MEFSIGRPGRDLLFFIIIMEWLEGMKMKYALIDQSFLRSSEMRFILFTRFFFDLAESLFQ